MKIAKEILDHLDVHLDFFGGLDKSYVGPMREFAESLIAAKLRPIRDALHMMWDNPESMTPSDMLAQYAAACEMLEENDA